MPRSSLDKCFICGGSPVVAAGVICDSPICQRDLVALLETEDPDMLKEKEKRLEHIEELLRSVIGDTLEAFGHISVDEWKLLADQLNAVHTIVSILGKEMMKVDEFKSELENLKGELEKGELS